MNVFNVKKVMVKRKEEKVALNVMKMNIQMVLVNVFRNIIIQSFYLQNTVMTLKRIVNIIVANGLSLQEDYGYVVPWLESQGFICNQINIHDFYFSEIFFQDSK